MTVPRLKRVKVSSEQELRTWLAKNADGTQSVMVVTCDRNSRDKFVGSDQVRAAAAAHGWAAGRSYTLRGNLVGHVVSHG
ncbi:hypothetical protein MWU52_14655 [Jannaschia sp. S6380]|uniref:hypothetical protein n=1 Tax=Jannaschia sp. S6380 TaxID=2926408 RepID=UPI001FF5977F|nr:hypothetical protein [Jannaschia sp. S6380]MCK0168797.1 hypothetical protein [Jannaschia sp. S6380]